MNTKLKQLRDASIQVCMGVKSIDPSKFADLILQNVFEIINDVSKECPNECRDTFYTLEMRIKEEYYTDEKQVS